MNLKLFREIAGDTALLHSYVNGGYTTSIYSDGTKIRRTIDATSAPILPEQMDLKITNWCDAGCAWCHENSTVKGAHGDLHVAADLLSQLNPGTEIAIGGGDPISHPDFAWFVRTLRGFGLVPSVTVNGRHFDRSLSLLQELTTEGSLFGVGFSYHNKLPDWDYEHLVVHLIAGINSPEVMDAATRSHKVLLLGYKHFGRGKKHFDVKTEAVSSNLAQWYRELFSVAEKHHISFDNLAIEQLKPQRLFARADVFKCQYMGEEGMFSMYLDAVTQTFGISSYSQDRQPWSAMAEMFAHVRSKSGVEKDCQKLVEARDAASHIL